MPSKMNPRAPAKRAPAPVHKLAWPFIALGVATALAGFYVLRIQHLWEGGVVFGIGGVLVMWGMSRNKR